MIRFSIVLACAVAIGISTILKAYAIGLTVGILAGAVFLFLGLSQNGGIVALRLANDPGRPSDPNTSISMGLGAAGIGAAAVGNPHFPESYRAFYLACLIAGIFIATIMSWRYRSGAPNPTRDSSLPRIGGGEPGEAGAGSPPGDGNAKAAASNEPETR